jgi:hypothetical protein
MFSESFREKIGSYKYSQWARDLTEDQFEALLGAVGEYGYRSIRVLQILRQHIPKDDPAFARAMVGLELLSEFCLGSSIDREGLSERLRKALCDVEEVRESRPSTETGLQT